MLAEERLAGGIAVERRPPLIVGYYTPDGYAQEAKRLRASLERFGLEHVLTPIANVASWSHAVMYKPTFLGEMLSAARKPILYVDADAEFMSVPDWGLLEHVDVGWHEFKRNRHAEMEFLTGTMYLAYTPEVQTFVADWAARTRDFAWHSTPEQASLKAVWPAHEKALVKRVLPPSWTYIFDDFRECYSGVEPVILHHQASRRLRR